MHSQRVLYRLGTCRSSRMAMFGAGQKGLLARFYRQGKISLLAYILAKIY